MSCSAVKKVALVLLFSFGINMIPASSAWAAPLKNPCKGLQGVRLPDSDQNALKEVQIRILKCAARIHKEQFGLKEYAQCVPFAYALMYVLHNSHPKVSSSGDTAAGYFQRLQALKKAIPAMVNARPKNQTRPLFVWWKDNMQFGHVGVYIGGDLFIDSQGAFLLATERVRVTQPRKSAWNIRQPRRQIAFSQIIQRPWPRRIPAKPDGYSVTQVNGDSCRTCQ